MSTSPEVLAELFDLNAVPNLRPRYNISPTQLVAMVRFDAEAGNRRLDLARWGLVPPWAKDPASGPSLINARAETLAAKPTFRRPFRSQRCLVPADGFYEWRKVDGARQPFFLHLRSGSPFAIAALWDVWSPPDVEPIMSCTLVTVAANEVVAPLHDRMPALVTPADFETWLDPRVSDARRLSALLGGSVAAELTYHPVSRAVNSPANDGPELVARVA